MRGIRTGASVVLLGVSDKNVDLRKAMRSSGLHAEHDPVIVPAIRMLIANGVPDADV